MSRFVAGVLIWIAALTAMPTLAAEVATTNNMEIFRQKVKADKKLVVAVAMQLTDAEAKGFWPIYDAYQKDIGDLNERTIKLIAEYAEVYNKGSVPDSIAKRLLAEFLAIDGAGLKLKQAYVPRLQEVLPPLKVARYMQVENKIRAAINYELAAAIPLAD